MYYLIITTLLHLYLIHVYTEQKLRVNIVSVTAALSIVAFKSFMFDYLSDSFMFFLVAWLCVFILASVFTENNPRRNLELSFFIELVNAMAYYISAGILLLASGRFDFEEVLNLSLIGQTNIPHIAITSAILISFGFFRRFVTATFQYERGDERNISGIFFILSINLIIQIMYYLNLSPGTKLILFVLINIFVMVFYVRNNQLNIEKARVRREIEEKENIIRELRQYVETIEELVDKFREFRHDCKNMLLGTGIEGDKIDEMIGQIESELRESTNFEIFSKLKDIKYLSLKSLLYYYIMNAIRQGIQVRLDMIGNVEALSISDVEFSRVIGILFENALEASSLSDEKKLEVFIESRKGSLNIAIGNTYKEPIPNVEQLFEKGFSTRGAGRGLGLHNLNTIIKKNPAYKLDSYIHESLFIQDLHIMTTL